MLGVLRDWRMFTGGRFICCREVSGDEQSLGVIGVVEGAEGLAKGRMIKSMYRRHAAGKHTVDLIDTAGLQLFSTRNTTIILIVSIQFLCCKRK